MSTEQDFKNLQTLWQQTTTNDSLKIKEREMIRDIQFDMETFDEKYGFGTWKMVIMSAIISALAIFSTVRDFVRGQKSPMILIAILYPIIFCFHLWTRLEMRKYDLSKTEEYFAYNLERVRRQMSAIHYGAPFVFTGLAIWLVDDFISEERIFTISLGIFTLIASVFVWWQYKYRLTPLRNRLRNALFDMRNPYKTE